LIGSDAYTEQFRWGDVLERDGEPQEVATAVVAELEAQYAEIDWRTTAGTLRQQRGTA